MPRSASARLSAALLQQIVDAARSALPHESVGLLVGVGVGAPRRYIALHNAAASPYRYVIDPAAQLETWTKLEDTGEEVWAVVHSHIASPAVPSTTDIELAYYPLSLYVICSLADPEQPTVRAWSIRDGSATEVALTYTG